MSEKNTGPYAMFQTSKQCEEQGVAIDYGTFAVVIKRADLSNKDFARAQRKFDEKHGKQIQLGVLPDGTDDILLEMFCSTVVVGWSGVTDNAGDELEFTVENCKTLLTDLPELYKDLQAKALSFATFRESTFEDVVGN